MSAETDAARAAFEKEIIEAMREWARDMTQAPYGSDERIRGVTLLGVLDRLEAAENKIARIVDLAERPLSNVEDWPRRVLAIATEKSGIAGGSPAR